jgi:hypothetical protein
VRWCHWGSVLVIHRKSSAERGVTHTHGASMNDATVLDRHARPAHGAGIFNASRAVELYAHTYFGCGRRQWD